MNDRAVTFDNVTRILRTSVYNSLMRGQAEVGSSWRQLKREFRDIKFNEESFTCINPYNKNEVPISYLLRRFTTTEQKTERFKQIQSTVNFLLNLKSVVASRTSNQYINEIFSNINHAIEKREKRRKGKHADHCAASDKISGKYEYDNLHEIYMSNDPIDIFMKSTGRPWEQDSCERVAGTFNEGSYSDIEWCNVIVYFCRKGDLDNPLGRVMVRTCTMKDGNVSFGIEPVWYTIGGRLSEEHARIDGITIARLDEKIISIIKSKGFPMDYKTCTTPYTYRGYSDQAASGGTVIEYGEGSVDISEILRGDNVRLAAECPFCGTDNEWEIEFVAEHVTRGKISRALKIEDTNVVDGFYVHNVDIDRIDNDFYSATGELPADGNCAGCGAAIISYEYNESEKTKFKKLLPKSKKSIAAPWRTPRPSFMHLDETTRIRIVSRSSTELRNFLLSKIDDYKFLHDRLKSIGEEEDFVEFVMEHEMKKDRVRKMVKDRRGNLVYPRYGCDDSGKSSIRITNRYNAGERSDDIDEDEIYIYISDKDIDFDEIVDEYVGSRYRSSSLASELMIKKKKIDVSKFKKFEKYRW